MSVFSPDLLDDKVALVTGGGSGINFSIARAFVEHGASVALVSRTQEKLDRAANELGPRAKGFAADVRDEAALKAAIDATIEAFGRIDILVNGAAGNFLAPAAALSPKPGTSRLSLAGRTTDFGLRASAARLRTSDFGHLRSRCGN